MQRLFLFSIFLIAITVHAGQPIDGSISGVWYDADHPGHGFVINVSEQNNQKTFLSSWYTYDPQRNQLWLIGTTPIDGKQSRITVPMNTTRGAMFGVDFETRDVKTDRWGDITFDFTDCNHGVVKYKPVQTGFVDGTLSITRLTNTASLTCIDNNTTIQVDDSSCDLTGTIVSIADGDTVTVLDSNRRQHKIRLAGIDAPELGQPFGNASKRFLSSNVAGQTVCIQGNKIDRYQRLVGKIMLNQIDINLEVVKAGLAWHYKKYQSEQSAGDRSAYSQAENSARSALLGLWSEPKPIAPWDWRKGVRPSTKPTPPPKPTNSFSCGSKKFCTQMNSCSEAQFHYLQCGLSRLDGDKDGVPCESLCR